MIPAALLALFAIVKVAAGPSGGPTTTSAATITTPTTTDWYTPTETSTTTVTSTSVSVVTQTPAAPRTAAAPPPTRRMDPEEAAAVQLTQIAAADRPLVSSQLADRWIPQLSSKRPGVVDDGIVWDNTSTLQEYLKFQQQYDAKLLWSGDWSTFDGRNFWVTVVPATFSSPDGALQWCTDNGFDSWHCLAKLVSTTRPIAGSTKVGP